MINLLARIFVISFFINLLYELLHSILYKTCLEAKLQKYVCLILKAAIFDGLSITIIYYLVYLLFGKFASYLEIIAFLVISLMFAHAWEKYSLRKKKWEYTAKMPIFLGVGITPLIQLATTGILSLYFIFNFY